MILIDSDVLIWYMRGNQAAYNIIHNYNQIHISAVTYIELLQGMRNKAELAALKKQLQYWHAKVISINETISLNALAYVEKYFLSHTVMLADALIAATAINYKLPLLTSNIKHYKMINNIELVTFKC